MKREGLIKQMAEEKRPWDLLIIGGGATGLGVAVDASSRGYRVLLVEQHDFQKRLRVEARSWYMEGFVICNKAMYLWLWKRCMSVVAYGAMPPIW